MTFRLAVMIGIVGLCLTGCKKKTEVVTYRLMYPSKSEQPAPEPAAMPAGHPPTAMPAMPGGMPGGMPATMPDGHPPVDMASGSLPNMPTPSSAAAFVWVAPENWVPQPGSNMRLGSFQVPGPEGSTAGDCSIIRLAGAAGGIVSNINRWRGQVGLAPQDEATVMQDIERLPTALGDPALVVELKGATDSILGAIIEHAGSALFVKLRGPEATLTANSDAFRQLVSSIDEAGKAAETP